MKKSLLLTLLLFSMTTLSIAAGDGIEATVESLLGQMTLEEKVRLCYAQSKFTSAGVARLGVPEVYTSDGPHGVRMEINWNDWNHAGWTNDYCTAFPALTCLAATWQPELALTDQSKYRVVEISKKEYDEKLD